MIDRGHIGRTWEPWEVDIETGRLKLLAKAIGETRPIDTDEGAARAAGYRSILGPPTPPYCLLTDSPIGQRYLSDLGIPTERMLLAEVEITCYGLICAGDRIRVNRRVADILVKKGGALELVVFESELANCADGQLVATTRSLIAVKNSP